MLATVLVFPSRGTGTGIGAAGLMPMSGAVSMQRVNRTGADIASFHGAIPAPGRAMPGNSYVT